MFNLHVLQAHHGDCLIVEYGEADKPKYMLVDGGPKRTYEEHLRHELLKIRDSGGKIERLVVSHVCNDHINGLVELFLDLRDQHIKKVPRTIDIESIWFNQFSHTIGKGVNFARRLDGLLRRPLDSFSMNTVNAMNYSVSRADVLVNIFKPFKIPINPETGGDTISVENLPQAIVNDNLSVQIIGPDDETIKNLREEWLEWIKKKEKGKEYENVFFKAMSDGTYQNLSSVVLLLESRGKKILLTGDARGDNIEKSLEKKGLLKNNKPFFVDILKLPHHGSERNVSEEFFEKVVADIYVISACKHGKTDNPDFSTLEWIIKSAEQRGEKVEIFVTNKNDSTDKIIREHGESSNVFDLEILEKKKNSSVFTLV